MTQRSIGAPRPRMSRPRRPRWTIQRRRQFLAVLAETSNVSAAAQAASMHRCTAYALKGRDPDFARAWKEALEQGYSDLELHLMRQSIGGTMRTETVIDGETKAVKQVRTIHSYPLTVAVRLLTAHRQEVESWRRETEAASGAGDDPGDVDALDAELEAICERFLAEDDIEENAGEAAGE
ncbi:MULTISPECIES: hypothetical protein [unclassified Sphingobium]|uniref:hypothetical protein n=1 Tax=unclassified Sphingobium TaxID=2611147 RepID=UPI0022258493|nr:MULTISPECIES: hypothetical protein [unclassified Sphingobium]MCW2382551.1 hypothetical protein [Sphingobium sp. B2D3B]MCW2397276.1 hypothetical protein [Sphingobium sp. B2D3C]